MEVRHLYDGVELTNKERGVKDGVGRSRATAPVNSGHAARHINGDLFEDLGRFQQSVPVLGHDAKKLGALHGIGKLGETCGIVRVAKVWRALEPPHNTAGA